MRSDACCGRRAPFFFQHYSSLEETLFFSPQTSPGRNPKTYPMSNAMAWVFDEKYRRTTMKKTRQFYPRHAEDKTFSQKSATSIVARVFWELLQVICLGARAVHYRMAKTKRVTVGYSSRLEWQLVYAFAPVENPRIVKDARPQIPRV